jgi:ketosteroid isomerase-like protein
MRLRHLLIVPLVFVSSSCSQPTPAPNAKPDLAVEEKAIRDADAGWLKAAQARDASAEASTFASDGVAYREHVDPLVGPAAFQTWDAKQYAENPKQIGQWTTEAIHISDSGDLAVQTGQYHVTGIGPKGDGEDNGRFVTVWKKVGGEWKVAHDIGSTTMPVAATEKRQ